MVGASSSRLEFGGDAPTLSPPASSSAGPGRFFASSSNIVASWPAPPTLTFDAVHRHRGRVELTVEVVEPDDGQRLDPAAVLEQLQQHPALRLLRLRNAEQVGDGRCDVDGPDLESAPADLVAAGQERGPHVDVVLQVLHVGHVAVLAEELGLRDQRAGRRRVELVRRVGEDHQVAGAGRVRHVGGGVRARSGCSGPRPG